MPWQEFRDCEQCGQEMLTWRPTQRFCSKKCRGAAERAEKNYPVAEWARLYETGSTYRNIATLYGVSYAVVRRSVQLAGIKPRTDHEHLRKYDNPRNA